MAVCSVKSVQYLSFQQWNCVCINPLTPELNPPQQRCLPEFFTGAFKF